LQLRDSAKADLGGSDKTKQEVAKDAAIALDRLSCMLQSFKGNPMDLPLSGKQSLIWVRAHGCPWMPMERLNPCHPGIEEPVQVLRVLRPTWKQRNWL